MNLLEAESKLLRGRLNFLTTRDAANFLGINASYASQILRRLAAHKRAVKLGRGRWILGAADPLSVAEYLTIPYPAYISLHTALFHHGMISQIPSTVYAVSLARTQRIQSPLGTYSIHHVSPEFFFGYELIGRSNIKMAVPEKALIDYLYLFPARSRLFRSLPELELPKKFKLNKAREIVAKITSVSRRSLVEDRFERIWRR